MRRLPRLVSFALLSVLALGLNATAGEEEIEPDGLPDLTGNYVGKVSFKFFPLDPSEKKEKGSFPATCTISQKGPSIGLDIEVESDEGLQQWTLGGVIGNGNFWVTNGSVTDPITLSGHVRGKEPKLKFKATGVLGGTNDLNEIKLSFAPAE